MAKSRNAAPQSIDDQPRDEPAATAAEAKLDPLMPS